MTILTRLGQWKEQGKISPEQHAHLAGLSREEPLSLFLELNVLLYAGVLAFVAGYEGGTRIAGLPPHTERSA